MKKILILQHEAHETAGVFEGLGQKSGISIQYCQGYAGQSIPQTPEELAPWNGILILGGSMSANDGEKLPFIRDELKLIEQTLKLKIPLLGVCLGSQLIAKALGVKVYPGAQKEIGWYPLQLSQAATKDNIFGMLPFKSFTFQWHGETFDLPSGAVLLGSSALYANQAFRYTDRVYALQFHCEMTEAMIREWIQQGQPELEAAGISKEIILNEMPKYLPTLRRFAQSFIDGWIKLVK